MIVRVIILLALIAALLLTAREASTQEPGPPDVDITVDITRSETP